MAAHKNICIKFTVDSRNFEAVGFLNDGERKVDAYTMLERTQYENNGAIADEDWEFLSERTNQFPEELREYALVTMREVPDRKGAISFFVCHCSDPWKQGWSWLLNNYDRFALVLRRCA